MIRNDPEAVKWLEEEALYARTFNTTHHRKFLELLEDGHGPIARRVAALHVVSLESFEYYQKDNWGFLYD